MKKILIIGGCGYIGSALFQKFSKNNYVDTVDLEWFGNYVNPSNIKSDFDLLTSEFVSSYDIIILVAANSSVQLCKDLYDTFNNNVNKFVNLAKKIKPNQKFIYASSSCVYDNSKEGELCDETDFLNPLDGLTLSKTAIDQFISLTDIEYYGLRFGSVNGWSPNMRLDLMINSMTISAKTTNQVNVFNGYAHRPILFINDLCEAVECIVNSTEDNRGIYNIASFNKNIFEIGKKVSEYMNVEFNDRGNNFTYDFSISSEKFIEKFNFKFNGTIESIVESIITNPIDSTWKKREIK